MQSDMFVVPLDVSAQLVPSRLGSVLRYLIHWVSNLSGHL